MKKKNYKVDEILQMINFRLLSLNTYSILLIIQIKSIDKLYINLISRENSHLLIERY